ncbi:MAG: glycosyltransferase family 2 protein [Candidatus Eremiobacteraeota bacterium]|nr:glycosyltransferase family 2 protein [Candidatus Eremiobacteraeota bacterium]
MQAPVVSVVCPAFNEEGNIPEVVERIDRILAARADHLPYEIIIVNDGSSDGTLETARQMIARYPALRVVNLSRNFGHQLAATAGIDVARGDAIVLIDSDLQDPPELIGTFLERWRQGYDVVYAVRRSRKGESRFKIASARWFYRLEQRLTNIQIPLDTGDFRLISRRVADVLRQSREKHRFLRGLTSWAGFAQIGVPYDREARHAGKSKYSLSKMLRFAIDGLTSFSEIPLRFATYVGFLVSGLSFVYAIVILALKFAHRNTPGYTSMMVAILFLGGVQLITIGILGEYVGRIYDQSKHRPLYVIDRIDDSATIRPPRIRTTLR